MTNAMSSLDVGVKPRPLGRYSSLGRTGLRALAEKRLRRHVLFHPDFNRRPRPLTKSADLPRAWKRSRAPGSLRIPPVGNFTRPREHA